MFEDDEREVFDGKEVNNIANEKEKQNTIEEQVASLQSRYEGMTREEAEKFLRGLELISDLNSNVISVGYTPRNGVKLYLDNKGGH